MSSTSLLPSYVGDWHSKVVDADALCEYLDHAIRAWRTEAVEAKNEEGLTAPASSRRHLTALCYVDAYQSVRASVFGETLQ